MNLLEDIKKDPYGRRHIINLWQEEDFKDPHGLKPCCYQTQFNVRGEFLDMVLYQRSSDWLTAGNINQMQYVAFMMMVARHTGYKPGIFTHFIANQQIYDRHVDNAKEMLNRTPIECTPVFTLNPDKKNFFDFEVEDFKLTGYKSNKPQLTFELGI
jgi:thymidylate synthase